MLFANATAPPHSTPDLLARVGGHFLPERGGED